MYRQTAIMPTIHSIPEDTSTSQALKTPRKTRVLLVSTHLSQTTGYSKVTFNLLRLLGVRKDLEIINYGFQNFNAVEGKKRLEKIPNSVIIYDAGKAEIPFQQGFGFAQFREFFRLTRPDVVIIFNDATVVTTFLVELKKDPNICPPDLKVITYLDQVYPHQRLDLLEIIHKCSDQIITFTEYWKQELLKQGVTKPVTTLCHGFDEDVFRILPQAPKQDPKQMVVLNLNRNQPRKRLDIAVIAMAIVFKKKPDANIRFVFATDIKNGAWNVADIFAAELLKYFPPEQAKSYLKRLLTVPNPQKLTDKQINQLYNECDIGLNTACGEGVGLCNMEHAGLGKPQVVNTVGGLTEFLGKECSILIQPKYSLFVDQQSEAMGGEMRIVDPEEVADAILKYYDDPELRTKHGRRARERVSKYRWEEIADEMYKVITAMT
jgi:D-inositol-3-phosphate glycosyltransferase